MNAIFFKEVADSVLKGKLVKLNYVDIGNEENIIEINISNKVISYINKDRSKPKSQVISNFKKNSWVNNIHIKYILIKFKNSLIKTLNKNSLIGYFAIYSNDLKKKQYVKEYIEKFLASHSINEYVNTNSVEENLDKYIEEYINKNSIKKENINPLIIVHDIENLNFDLINNLNEKYKEVNIYTKIKPNKRFLNKIKNINDEYGSCIGVLNKSDRDFKKYNIYIFVDKSRSEYAGCKLNKKAGFIDFTNKENDRFNKNYIKLENEIKNNKYSGVKIKELYELYGKITVATVIKN